MDGVDDRLQTYSFLNHPSGMRLNIDLVSANLMPPSFSTQLLIQDMVITPGTSVLDIGAGTGVVGIAAKKLGAGAVTLLEVQPHAHSIMQSNVARNHGDASGFEYVVGDLCAPLGRRRFDHIIANPPSIPSLDESLPLAHRSGPDGRLLHDAIQHLARYYLKANGRLTIVHSSLANFDLSLGNLRKLGFKCTYTGPYAAAFRDFYPLDHIRNLSDGGHARFFIHDGIPHENRYVIHAVIEEEYRSPVMSMLDDRRVDFRMLPHKRIAKTVQSAAAEREVPVEEMVKCILLKDKTGKFVLACLTGEAELDVQRVREYAEGYARLSFASPEEITAVTGYELGSVAPFSLRAAIPLVFDDAITRRKYVNISSGDPRLGLELTVADFMRCVADRVHVGTIRKNGMP